jgi:hypothetical protein
MSNVEMVLEVLVYFCMTSGNRQVKPDKRESFHSGPLLLLIFLRATVAKQAFASGEFIVVS